MSENRSAPVGSTRPPFFTLFAVVLMFIGLGALVFGSWKLVDGLATNAWQPADATVTAAEISQTDNDDELTPRHTYRVTVEYVVDGQTHTLSFQTGKQSFEPRIGEGELIRYNPANPADARRGAGGGDLIAGPIVAVLGLALAVTGFILFRRSRRGPITAPSFTATRSVNRTFERGGDQASGEG